MRPRDSPLRSAEIYSSRTDQWTLFHPMPKALMGMAVVTVDNSIWIFGGLTRGSEGSSIEDGTYVFDPRMNAAEIYSSRTDQWTLFHPMPKALMGMAVVTVDNSIWIFGGLTRGSEGSSIEDGTYVFDPRMNATSSVSLVLHCQRLRSASLTRASSVLTSPLVNAIGFANPRNAGNSRKRYRTNCREALTVVNAHHVTEVVERFPLPVGSKVYLMRGQTTFNNPCEEVITFNHSQHRFLKVTDTPKTLMRFAAVLLPRGSMVLRRHPLGHHNFCVHLQPNGAKCQRQRSVRVPDHVCTRIAGGARKWPQQATADDRETTPIKLTLKRRLSLGLRITPKLMSSGFPQLKQMQQPGDPRFPLILVIGGLDPRNPLDSGTTVLKYHPLIEDRWTLVNLMPELRSYHGAAHINDTIFVAGTSPLMLAASGGHLRVAQMLMDHGADPNQQNIYGNTALDIATACSNMEAAEYLRSITQLASSQEYNPTIGDVFSAISEESFSSGAEGL
ncbi:hypothetical protein HPB51_023870 [Rhipicephalus microplus]|uniref:Uncharacterized protein n=1 Tax=Rhipicephalus microplus TaxID=6941 RepID=A0A9J6DDD5_RHIMP|nr:hypothetical protein HPB51_023870 [Rhipicephalus microplus]